MANLVRPLPLSIWVAVDGGRPMCRCNPLFILIPHCCCPNHLLTPPRSFKPSPTLTWSIGVACCCSNPLSFSSFAHNNQCRSLHAAQIQHHVLGRPTLSHALVWPPHSVKSASHRYPDLQSFAKMHMQTIVFRLWYHTTSCLKHFLNIFHSFINVLTLFIHPRNNNLLCT